VGIVTAHGEDTLISRLQATAKDEREADIVISTAHKAKGREWDTVALMDDFLPSRPAEDGAPPPIDDAELRLFYVALTRGRVAVDAAPSCLSQFGIPAGPKYPSQRLRAPEAASNTPKPQSDVLDASRVIRDLRSTSTASAAPKISTQKSRSAEGISRNLLLIVIAVLLAYIFLT
jgi:superfamily I DNA/RNA helicase